MNGSAPGNNRDPHIAATVQDSPRNRLAVWLCNLILRRVATREYRLTLDAVIREGLRRG